MYMYVCLYNVQPCTVLLVYTMYTLLHVNCFYRGTIYTIIHMYIHAHAMLVCMLCMVVYIMYSLVVSEEQNLCIRTYPFVFREEMKSSCIYMYVCVGFAFIEELKRQLLIHENCELKGFPYTVCCIMIEYTKPYYYTCR